MIAELVRAICAVSGASKVALTFSEHEDRFWEAKATFKDRINLTETYSCSSHHDDPIQALRGLSDKIRTEERD